MSGSVSTVLDLFAPSRTAATRPALRPAPAPLQAPQPLRAPDTPESTYDFPLPAARLPRCGVAVNGKRLDQWLVTMEVVNNRYYTADSFRVTLALREADPEFGLSYWSDQGQDGGMEIELFGALSDEEMPSTSLLVGRVDDMRLGLGARTVTLFGRDRTADLIEAVVAEKWPNRTASDIVRELAGRYGLTPVVTETKTQAGVYYRHEHASMADETNAWNLITWLAEREGFDAFVLGRELHFGPPPDPAKSPVWVLQYEPSAGEGTVAWSPTSSLDFSRSLTASRDIQVKVISWDSGKKSSITGIARTRRPARSSGGQFTAQSAHTFRTPGLTQEQADREAERLLREITRNMRGFEANLPGDPRVDIRTVVRVRGTGGSFDCDYHLDEITRRYDQDGGLAMDLRGRNIVPADTAAL